MVAKPHTRESAAGGEKYLLVWYIRLPVNKASPHNTLPLLVIMSMPDSYFLESDSVVILG